jgi:L-threonylcarbamoyladenylate synthase
VKFAVADEAGLELAAGILRAGGVVVLPTDTVYGLAAHPDFPEAVKRLYSIKERDAAKPIALLAADETAAARYIGDEAAAVGAKYWPGALTLVAGGEGVRVPAHGWLRRLIGRCGGALRVTSANLSGRRAATDAEAALAEVGLSADLTVDDGISPGGTASSVWKIDRGGIEILREGPVKP